MTRRIKRHKSFELSLDIKSDDFIHTPKDSQRNWLLNRCLKEWGDELLALDRRANDFISGGDPIEMQNRKQAALAEQEIMEDWQIPIMQAMAKQLPVQDGDILEVGFGRGVASSMLQDAKPGSHTIIECNEHVIKAFEAWRSSHSDATIHLLAGLWQDLTEQLQHYDGIFFHTYPLDVEEYAEQVAAGITFAGNFFPVAAKHLRTGGAFTYLTNETDSLSRAHQRLLLQHFSSFSITQVKDLKIPQDSRDAHWSNQMVVIKAVK